MVASALQPAGFATAALVMALVVHGKCSSSSLLRQNTHYIASTLCHIL
jgi:hypothetical protein